MRKGRAWNILKLARMHFLVPGIMLYTLGALLAAARGSALTWDRFLFGYSIFFLAHLSVSFSNDYFDREGDARSEPTPLSGGSGVLVEHPELARFSLGTAIALLLASGLVAAAFTWHFGYDLTFLAFAVLGGWLGWLYSAPPLRLAYRGMGEVTTLLAAGLVMPGMGYYVISGRLDLWFLALSAPLMCYGLFFILTVEMPDVESDSISGKSNLLVRHGRGRGALLSLLACLVGSVLFLGIHLSGALGREVDFGLISLFSLLPLAIAAMAKLHHSDERGQVVRQVKLNFASMMGFLLLVNLMLLGSLL